MKGSGLLKLGQLAENLRRLASVPSRVSRPVSDEIAKSIQKQFDDGVNAYGRAWAALAPSTLAKGRTPPPLTDTRAMRNSLNVRPASAAGVQISIGFPAGIHQGGSPKTNLPARPVLPTGVFPRTWTEIVERVTRDYVGRTMKGERT